MEYKEMRKLKCDYTEDQLKDFSSELASTNVALKEKEEEKKAVAAQMKAEAEEMKARIDSLARKVSNGYEYKDVKCTKTIDFEEGRVVVHRNDTLEIIEERGLTDYERQLTIDVEADDSEPDASEGETASDEEVEAEDGDSSESEAGNDPFEGKAADDHAGIDPAAEAEVETNAIAAMEADNAQRDSDQAEADALESWENEIS